MTATTDLPAPLVPADLDIVGFGRFMLDIDRLFASELWALSSGEEFKAAVALWGRAWQQTPAGSLPDDERLLAAFSGAGKRWPKIREVALRGFVKCSDGRLYHRVLCDEALRAATHKKERLERTAKASEARRKKADEHPTPPSGGKKHNGINGTDDRHDQRHDDRNEGRDDDRHDVRHEKRHDAHAAIVTTNATRSNRRNGTLLEERDSLGPAREPVPAEPPPAVPGQAWASRESFDRIERRCREAMPDGGPQDLRIGSIARLVADGFDLEAEVIPNLLDVAAAARVPIRTWAIYADRIAERVAIQRKGRAADGLAPIPPAPPKAEEIVDLGAPYGTYAEPVLRVFVTAFRKDNTAWMPHLVGPPPGQPGCRIPPRLLVEAA